MKRRLIGLGIVIGLLAVGPACAKKNEDKLSLQRIVQSSAHRSGVFRYSDETPKSLFAPGSLVQVRGLIEDDFRFKARLTVDGTDALDEVVNDDALAVRFLDPSFVPRFTGRGGEPTTRAELAARYWVSDPIGAPPIGDAAVADNVIGVDPIVDSLSVVDYVSDAIAASAGVAKFNAEAVDYRPLEDPFPRPADGSGVTRWDLAAPGLPKVDAVGQSQGNAFLARTPVFRKMAIYVKNGKVVQIREEIGAKFELLDKFKDYLIALVDKLGDKKIVASVRSQIKEVENEPALLEAVLNLGLNQSLVAAGEDPIRFHSMKYEFSAARNVRADLPVGPDVKKGSLAFFGVNSKTNENATNGRGGGSGSGATTTTTLPGDTTTTTSAPPQ